MKVVIGVPTLTKPHDALLKAIENAIPALDRAGIDHSMVSEVGCPYISCARATLLRKAFDTGADAIVFLDHDVSFFPEDLLKLIETDGDVVAGTYRFKKDDEEYMGALIDAPDHRPIVRKDGCIAADRVPAGFLKITRSAVERFKNHFPHLIFKDRDGFESIDLFNHGAHEGLWYGEDYAFSRNWLSIGGEIWLVPDLDITHHTADRSYPGNFHQFLMRQPGGSKA